MGRAGIGGTVKLRYKIRHIETKTSYGNRTEYLDAEKVVDEMLDWGGDVTQLEIYDRLLGEVVWRYNGLEK